ncbi:1539_t:CDS:10 [Funneliformis geosporum]|nr:1539_t:CDS:10 [Funneliformis geosporum]
MSLDAFRKQVLSNVDGEERVEVNQRHLIDKILARYSAEFVVYRELMQNSGRVWTTFLMDMREPAEFPNVEEFARFLANSLGFTGNLREISVYFNNTLVIRLSKKMQEPRLMNIASGFNTFSPQKMFHLTSVDVRGVQLDVKRLLVPTNKITRQWLPIPITDYQVEETSMFLRIASGNLDVKVSEGFSLEMERITKKKPPKKTTIQMIFTGFDEHNSSGNYNKNISPVFRDLLPYPEQGRIYIGFSTHQTTGCCSHLAARVIPTVERESIDLVDKTLAKYNNELLCIAGILCRILYEDEMTQITRLYNEMIGTDIVTDDENVKSVRDWFEKRAAHALTHFTFKPSTPNVHVGRITELQFFSCSKQQLSILSTNGVFPISNVRMPNPEMAGFIKRVPVVPKVILEQCDVFFKKAKDLMKLIEELSIQDVLYELKCRKLSEDEMVELLKWLISYKSKGNIVNQSDFTLLMQLATVRIGDQLRALNTFDYYLNPSIIPPDVDLPVEVLPYSISKNLQRSDLENFGWIGLSLVTWSSFIVRHPDLEISPAFAEKVHYIIERQLKNTIQSDKEIIRQLFVPKKCVPTKFGMKLPTEAYFQNVNLFPDLPTILFQKPLNVQNIMQLLGVRKVVELQLIFDRLVSQGNWDHMQLVKYLSSISNNLKDIETKRLKITPIWPKENLVDSQPNNGEPGETKPKPKVQRFVASDLYAPLVLHREFGLPVLDWKGKWTRNTQEGKFLIELGLREFPSLKKILELAAPPTDPKIRIKALKYFIDNFKEKYSKVYNPADVKIPFLPCSDPSIYAKPLECFINPECEIMKFQAIHQDLRFQAEQFGVRQHPGRENLLNRLIENPPQEVNKAKGIFEYLASRQGSFVHSDWNTLINLKFIPIRDKIQPNIITHTNPRSCFFKGQEESLNDFFSYIDFGEKANKFLQSCGVKNEPSPIEFAELLVKSSQEFWNSIGDNVEKYLTVLRRIAINFNIIAKKQSLIAEMRKAPILLAVRKRNSNSERINSVNKNDFGNEEVDQYCLGSAREIFINDDTVYQQVFNPLSVPEEDYMEMLYKNLGCRSLRESVRETVTPMGNVRETESSRKLQGTIIERSRLFYHDYSKNEIKRGEEWLKKLKVREIDQIETIYLLTTSSETKKEFTTTCLLHDKWKDSWTLFVTPDPDFLDISQHIVKSIYNSHKWKDISHLNMLLTTHLSSLKRKGYPIDRILRQPKLQRVVEKYDKKMSDQEPENSPIHDKAPPIKNNPSSSVLPPKLESCVSQLQEAYPDCDPEYIRKCLLQEKDNHLDNVANRLAEEDYPQTESKSLRKLGWNLFSKVTKSISDYTNLSTTKPLHSSKPIESSANMEPSTVTPKTTRDLRNVLNDAIKTCRSNSGSVIDSQASVKIVSESQTSYCDVIPGHSLHCVGNLQGIELYVPKGQSEMLYQSCFDPLNRFVNILKDLVIVFDLAPKAIHVFYDNNASSIAFNRDKALFFNLKFYLGLHDEECKTKPTSDAMTYWFMTFCHELAHNFIPLHNSEHEYYFSSFAENYMSNFLAIMKKHGIL